MVMKNYNLSSQFHNPRSLYDIFIQKCVNIQDFAKVAKVISELLKRKIVLPKRLIQRSILHLTSMWNVSKMKQLESSSRRRKKINSSNEVWFKKKGSVECVILNFEELTFPWPFRGTCEQWTYISSFLCIFRAGTHRAWTFPSRPMFEPVFHPFTKDRRKRTEIHSKRQTFP